MPSNTPNRALPYPLPTEPLADGANAIKNLAQALDVLPAAAIVTALPASPWDGLEVVLVDSVSAPTFAWRLRWCAAPIAKWLFMGGNPMRAEVAAMGTIASNVYVDPSLATPTLTLPRAGLYEATFTATGINNSGADGVYLALKLGAAATADAESAGGYTALTPMTLTQVLQRTAAAADVWKLQARRANATTITFTQGRLLVRPVSLT